jgi:hypothetical protein
VVMTPLAAVATRLHGMVVNVSTRGVKVHFDTLLNEQPRAFSRYLSRSGDPWIPIVRAVRGAALAMVGPSA